MKAVNTLWVEDGLIWGDNTDVAGFMAHLDASLGTGWEQDVDTALVIGAGGAARAVVAGLQDRPLEAHSRHEPHARRRRRNWCAISGRAAGSGSETLAWEDARARRSRMRRLIVNTTSLGMAGQPPLALDLGRAPRNAAVADIVYVPLRDAASRRRRGARICAQSTGSGMLLHQAVPGFERWFGVRPQVTPELRAMIVADIEGQSMTFVLGLTGSIGMGKSATADLFRRLGVPVHDADATVHALYRGRAAPLIEKAFPGTVGDGVVDRAKLGGHRFRRCRAHEAARGHRASAGARGGGRHF